MPPESAPSAPGTANTFRTTCLVVVTVAGVAGTVMMVAPDSTDRYFSWPIGPPPLAALVGAFYLASAALFAVLARQDHWSAVRGVCFAILAFTLPTVAATVRHSDLLDWSRWQALAWVALFAGGPIAFSSFLFLHRGGHRSTAAAVLPGLARAALAVLATVYVALSLVLLLRPAWLQARSPFALPGLSGRFLGSWCAFLGVLALFAIWRDRRDEAAIPVLALMGWPAAGIVAAIRTYGDLQPGSRRAVYLAALIALAAAAAAAWVALARPTAPHAGPAGAEAPNGIGE